MSNSKVNSIIAGIRRIAAPSMLGYEENRFVVEPVYTDDGDLTEDFHVFDTKKNKVVLVGDRDRAIAVSRHLNKGTDSEYVR